MRNIQAFYETRPNGNEKTLLTWRAQFEVTIPGTQDAMAAIIRRVWTSIIEKAQKLFP
jgi:hypothetical protein